jgi:hypothetical protein
MPESGANRTIILFSHLNWSSEISWPMQEDSLRVSLVCDCAIAKRDKDMSIRNCFIPARDSGLNIVEYKINIKNKPGI